MTFSAPWVNSYYIHDTIPTLVDAGVNTDECLNRLSSSIERTGGSIAGIRRVIVTHGHGDHLGVAGRIADISGADVFIHPWDSTANLTKSKAGLAHLKESLHAFFQEGGVPAGISQGPIEEILLRFDSMFGQPLRKRILSGETTFSFDDFFLQVIHTPGHTPGSICLFNRDDGTIFSGDSLLEEITCNPAAQAPASEENRTYYALTSYQDSLQLIQDLPVQRVLPGHGAPYRNHRTHIRQLRHHHQRRRQDILRILEDHRVRHGGKAGATAFMVASELFPSFSGIEIFHRICAVRVHLEVLEQQGLVRRCRQNGDHVWYCLA
ncbi:MAG: MBL fold metallo-hydrolase [Deltaproteobacteria bacterium]